MLAAIQAVKDQGLLVNSENVAKQAGVDASSINANSEFIKLLVGDATAADDKSDDKSRFDETAELVSFGSPEKFRAAGISGEQDLAGGKPVGEDGTGSFGNLNSLPEPQLIVSQHLINSSGVSQRLDSEDLSMPETEDQILIQILSHKLDQMHASLVGVQNEKQELYRHLFDLETFNRNLIARLTQLEKQVELQFSQERETKRVYMEELTTVQKQLSDQIHKLENDLGSAHAGLEGRLKAAENTIQSRPAVPEGGEPNRVYSDDLEIIKQQLSDQKQRLSAGIENAYATLHGRIRDLEKENQNKAPTWQESDLKKLYAEDLASVRKQVAEHVQRLTGGLENAIAKMHGRLRALENASPAQTQASQSQGQGDEKTNYAYREEISSLKEQVAASIRESTANLEKSNESVIERVRMLEEQIAASKDDTQKQGYMAEIAKVQEQFSSNLQESAATFESLVSRVLSLEERAAAGLTESLDFENIETEIDPSLDVNSVLKNLKAEITSVRTKISKRIRDLESDLEDVHSEIGAVKNEVLDRKPETVRAEGRSESGERTHDLSGLEEVYAELGYVRKELSEQKQELTETVRVEIRNEISQHPQALSEAAKVEVFNEVKQRSQEMIEASKVEVLNEVAQRSQEMIEASKAEVLNEVAQRAQELIEASKAEVLNEVTQRTQELVVASKAEVLNEVTQRSQEEGTQRSQPELTEAAKKEVLNELLQQAQELTEAKRAEVLNDITQRSQELTEATKTEVLKEISQRWQELAEATKTEVLAEITQRAQELTEAARVEVRNEISRRAQELNETSKSDGGSLQPSQKSRAGSESDNEVSQRVEELESDLESVTEQIKIIANEISNGHELASGLESVKEDVQSLKTELAGRSQELVAGLESLIEEIATIEHSIFERTDRLTVGSHQLKERLSELEANQDGLKREISDQEISLIKLKKPLEVLLQSIMKPQDFTMMKEVNDQISELQNVLSTLNEHSGPREAVSNE